MTKIISNHTLCSNYSFDVCVIPTTATALLKISRKIKIRYVLDSRLACVVWAIYRTRGEITFNLHVVWVLFIEGMMK